MKRTTRKLDTILHHLDDVISEVAKEVKEAPDGEFSKRYAELKKLGDTYRILSLVMLERYKEGR